MSILVKHAKENVWCEPSQDAYHTFKPWRVSNNLGAGGRIVIQWYTVNLPTSYPDRYHAYHVGKIDADRIGLNLKPGMWMNLHDLIHENRAVIDFYMSNGTIIPKSNCYVMILGDYSVVLAVKVTKVDLGKVKFISEYNPKAQVVPYRLDSGDLFARFYRNMRFSTPSWQGTAADTLYPVRSIQRNVANLAQYNAFIGEVNAIKAKFETQGAGLFYRDGYVESLPRFYAPAQLNKALSYVYDASIKAVQFHKLKGLRQFDSKLDAGKSKYIILSTSDYGTIDYLDDVDFYVCQRETDGTFRGVFFNRYVGDAIRMLTHNAWSLNADYVNVLSTEHGFELPKVEIMAVIRQGALIRGLVHQHNRVEELYRLSRAQILNIMSGSVTAVPEWHASELENSSYCKIMGIREQDITDELVVSGYGYNAVIAAAEPVIVNGDEINGSVFKVPPLFTIPDPNGTGSRTVFVYADDRKLINYYGSDSLSENEIMGEGEYSGAGMVELFHANLDELYDGTYYDKDVTSKDLDFWGYRCYVTPMVGGVPTSGWRDVTGGPFYTVSRDANDVPSIKWNWGLLDGAGLFCAVRLNGTMHVYEAELPSDESDYDGIIKLTIGSNTEMFGSTIVRPMTLAPAVCDIYMDGYALIRGVDYVVKWPTVVISRRPDGPISETKVIVRTYGCCDKDTMLPYSEREVGFVKGGALSVDGEFDIRNDRNIRVNIAGRIYSKEEAWFAEDTVGAPVTDGLPFIVEDYITPIEPYCGFDTVDQRARSFGLDKKVQAYLTTQLSEHKPTLPTIVFERYRLFSPFLNAVIHEMLFGTQYSDSNLSIRYGNVEVEQWITGIKYVLNYDPAYVGFNTDYVVVYPHLWQEAIEVTPTQFTFLKYLIRNYLHDRVELSQSVNIRSV